MLVRPLKEYFFFRGTPKTILLPGVLPPRAADPVLEAVRAQQEVLVLRTQKLRNKIVNR